MLAWPRIERPALALSLVAVACAALAYHYRWSAWTSFLSFGERVAGKALENGQKIWRSPYSRSRVLLYLTMTAGFWLTTMTSAPRPKTLGVETCAIAIAAVSMLLIGRGVAWGLLGMWLYRVLEYAQVHSIEQLSRWGAVQLDLVVVGIASLVVAFYYSAVWRGTVSADVTP
ncbi:MAG TPA: hypothetical protein VEO54_00085 [Thermoanaerobaculia bacterium]|nr:hypothetical protein [Thermoanaerobaculia bacterium]